MASPGPMKTVRADAWKLLWEARQGYQGGPYDEVLEQVQHRVAAEGSIGKADIGALVLWKRLNASTRWADALMRMTDRDVRELTAVSVAAVNDVSRTVPDAARAGRSALSSLPGCTTGDALASALLLAAAPDRMAVYDRRAHDGLTSIGVTLDNRPGRYGRYMERVEALRALRPGEHECMSARDIDIALYLLGG